MSSFLIVSVGLVYLCVAVEQFYKGNVGMGIAFLGYAFSNIGLAYLA